jgi:hypothetical protein
MSMPLERIALVEQRQAGAPATEERAERPLKFCWMAVNAW